MTGTADFVRRVPLFAIDLALEDEHGPAVAVSALPMSRLLLVGGRGLGCWELLDGDDLTPDRHRVVDGRDELDGAAVCAHNLRAWSPTMLAAVHARCVLRDSVHSVRRLLSAEVHAVIVAGAGMGYDDLACLPALVEEAGGQVTDLHGRPVLDGDGTVLATNGVLHEAFLELLHNTR